ncbi:MAG TPA: acyl-CoA dehydrogenase family protein [Acidimicrobiales bacterium]|nr:acyl-CoA dehydrogenase family protein [Acidimicrobiales bacterium]
MTDTAARTDRGVTSEVTAWLEENWDPDLTVGEWWDRLGNSGWAAPTWPEEWFGKGLSRQEAVAVQGAIARFGALGAPGGLGLLLAGPTIATHGSDDQKRLYLSDIVTGRRAWCQLFSEPGAGSDLAGLQTRAVRDGDEWVVTGQKVWTSGGQIADLGMLLARTDTDVPKHQGISYFALDMHQPGVEVRPLREMTGRAMFNEVFINEARVSHDALIGGLNNGWAVANTTLAFERAGLGAGGGSAAGGLANPGTVAGNLDQRAGDFVRAGGGRRGGNGSNPGMFGAAGSLLVDLARQSGKASDPVVRQDLMRLHTLNEIARFTNLRQRALRETGQDIPGVGNIAKLSMSRILRLSRDLGLQILGPVGTLHAYDPAQRPELEKLTGNPAAAFVTEMALFTQGPSIYGGTDEVQHNIIGERVLGLPKEPSNDRTVAFKDLPRNG